MVSMAEPTGDATRPATTAYRIWILFKKSWFRLNSILGVLYRRIPYKVIIQAEFVGGTIQKY